MDQTKPAVSNQTIWKAIQQLKSDMLSHFDSKMDNIQANLNTIQGSLSTVVEQVLELEHRVSANKDNISDLENHVKTPEKENSYLKEKVEDAENRSRSSNLRFLHVPE